MKHRVFFTCVLLSTLLCACGQRAQPRSSVPARNGPPEPPAVSATPDKTPGLKDIRSSPEPSAPAPEPRKVSFETPLVASGKNRTANIRLVAGRLNGKRIEPGEEFSFNRTVGARTVKAGYRKATIFVHGVKKKANGGGVCQVSTTLYNAALAAGFEITERHEHSRDVNYIGEGRDATVDYGHLDLKFVNHEPRPYQISCTVNKNAVTVTLTECI